MRSCSFGFVFPPSPLFLAAEFSRLVHAGRALILKMRLSAIPVHLNFLFFTARCGAIAQRDALDRFFISGPFCTVSLLYT